MGMFGNSKNEKTERRELKSQINQLMQDYKKEKIDGETYFNKMMNLTTSYRDKRQ